MPTRAFLRLSTALLNATWLNPLTSPTMSPRASRAVLSTVATLLIKLVSVATVLTKFITWVTKYLIEPSTSLTSLGFIDFTISLRALERLSKILTTYLIASDFSAT